MLISCISSLSTCVEDLYDFLIGTRGVFQYVVIGARPAYRLNVSVSGPEHVPDLLQRRNLQHQTP